MTGIERLHQIMVRLRDSKNGCPWDRIQTLDSLKPCLLEETYELLAAMDRPEERANYIEELGDVLLQIMFQCVMAEERGSFSFDDVANGIADNMLITTYLSMKAPVVVAPAMDLDMYAHHTTQQNLQALRRMGVSIIEPATGALASHLMGKGRMEEPENIFVQIATMLRQRDELQGVTVMVTAGPTVERIDPVRYISNDSTGKMGFALAEALAERGANVKLVCGPTALQTVHPGIERIDVQSAAAMYEAATTLFPQCHAAILCAAVADFTPENTSDTKIKRGADDMIIRLKPTQDIAATLGRTKRADQVLVGFALETHDAVEHAKDKLRRKNLDFIVLNSLADPGAGFGYDTNKVTLIDADDCVELPLMAKTEVADHIVEQLCAKLDALHS